MAKRCPWSQEDLIKAVQDIREKRSTYRKAEAAYGIPKSTLFDYATGKSEIGSKPGPDTVLTTAEEDKIVEYVIEMSKIGYGHTREQILEIVKRFIEVDGRPNPFKNNRPGRKWWQLFLKRHPILLTHEPLQLAHARGLSSESQSLALSLLENAMKPETVQLYNQRYEEGYDVEVDELYVVWSKFKALAISDDKETTPPPPTLPVREQKVSPALQMIEYLQNKKDEKLRLEVKKAKRKEDRERKKKEREEFKEKERKRIEREKKKEAVARLRLSSRRGRGGRGKGGCGRGGRGAHGRGGGSRQREVSPVTQSDSTQSDKSGGSLSESDQEVVCPKCQQHSDGRWIYCEKCGQWFHFECVGLIEEENAENADWNCSSCDCN